jgi:hypothetical protein
VPELPDLINSSPSFIYQDEHFAANSYKPIEEFKAGPKASKSQKKKFDENLSPDKENLGVNSFPKSEIRDF